MPVCGGGTHIWSKSVVEEMGMEKRRLGILMIVVILLAAVGMAGWYLLRQQPGWMDQILADLELRPAEPVAWTNTYGPRGA